MRKTEQPQVVPYKGCFSQTAREWFSQRRSSVTVASLVSMFSDFSRSCPTHLLLEDNRLKSINSVLNEFEITSGIRDKKVRIGNTLVSGNVFIALGFTIDLASLNHAKLIDCPWIRLGLISCTMWASQRASDDLRSVRSELVEACGVKEFVPIETGSELSIIVPELLHIYIFGRGKSIWQRICAHVYSLLGRSEKDELM